jgi:MSHA biogenesis protein MshN
VRGLLQHRLGGAPVSLINKMLQDLDKRHASQGGLAARTEGLAQHVRPVTPRKVVSDVFWRIMAVAMLISVGWVAWLVWQLTPRSVVTELAYDSARKQAVPPGETAPLVPATATVAAVVTAPNPIAADAARVGGPPPAASRDKVSFDMLRLATEMTTPVLERARPVPKPAAPKKAAAPRRSSGPAVASTASTAPDEAGKIERRANTTPVERAESEFRRAVTLVNQGRIAEGMDGLRNALKISPTHETARQTLVALLLEAKRVDEAAAVLQEGLALNPENTGFAMLLARALVERNDLSGALAVLQKHAVAPDRNADFHAFAGALYQRLDRHNEAIEQYQSALRLAPSAGIWWVGLGISYQAVERPREALEAFNTAKSAGSLAPDLLGFVDQRLKQLQ